jgi:hypothetical protein
MAFRPYKDSNLSELRQGPARRHPLEIISAHLAGWAQRKPMKALRVSGESLEVRLPDKR